MKKITLSLLIILLLFSINASAVDLDMGLGYSDVTIKENIQSDSVEGKTDYEFNGLTADFKISETFKDYLLNFSYKTMLGSNNNNISRNDETVIQYNPNVYREVSSQSDGTLNTYSEVDLNLQKKINDFYLLKAGYLNKNINIEGKNLTQTTRNSATGNENTITKERWLTFEDHYSLLYAGFGNYAENNKWLVSYVFSANSNRNLEFENQDVIGSASGNGLMVNIDYDKELQKNLKLFAKADLLILNFDGQRDYYNSKEVITDVETKTDVSEYSGTFGIRYNF